MCCPYLSLQRQIYRVAAGSMIHRERTGVKIGPPPLCEESCEVPPAERPVRRRLRGQETACASPRSTASPDDIASAPGACCGSAC